MLVYIYRVYRSCPVNDAMSTIACSILILYCNVANVWVDVGVSRGYPRVTLLRFGDRR